MFQQFRIIEDREDNIDPDIFFFQFMSEKSIGGKFLADKSCIYAYVFPLISQHSIVFVILIDLDTDNFFRIAGATEAYK